MAISKTCPDKDYEITEISPGEITAAITYTDGDKLI
jgi:hypothetical protein